MAFDALSLARLQFALTIMFHYLFPPLTIGLGVFLVFLEWKFLRTGDKMWEDLARFWTGIFAVNFAVGVATGIVMEFQFGTNWSSYARFVGDVFGSALAAEGVFAFFLESGFLAVLVFGWDRVSPAMHFFSTLMVSLGSMFSAIWIVVANSWQQTPAGYHIVTRGGVTRAEIVDFWAMVFNPSAPHRLLHVLLGSFILGAFFVLSVTAYYILKGRHVESSKRAFSAALVYAAVSSLLMLVSGHEQARKVAFTQPAKLAAFEAVFKTGPADLDAFGWVDEAHQTERFNLAIPGGLSWLIHGDRRAPVTGLDAFAAEDRPPVAASYYTYHLMVGLGFLFVLATLAALALWWRGTLFERRSALWFFVFAVAGPYIANQAGWVAAEVGRQPWVVYGLLRTKDGVSKTVPADQIAASIVLFSLIYLMLFAVWVYVLDSKIQHGPDEGARAPGRTTPQALLEAASELSDPSGRSLTEGKQG